ncbi:MULTISPECIES: type II toxin-antitoxin system YafQ family toxin [unclassified Bartonella]|uniref:type II toxin-antitoxin system YafQ family toxin n=1 Tax=unclassified Bartonella TaxID=2645622 RepID=UPI0035CF3B41
MRTIERTTIFKRDFKREMKGRYRHLLDTDLRKIIAALANDQPLEPRYHDHALTGNWSNYRDCHIRPDLVLIYRLIGQDRLILVRLGSHSKLDL